MEDKKKEELHFGRGSKPMNLEVERAKGSLIWDTDGKKYIDFLGGSGVGSFGWANEVIEMSIRNSARPTYIYPNFRYKGWTELAKMLTTITPAHLTTSFRTTGGSEAVEAAMQLAMMYTGRKKFVSLEGSYHGNTLGALSIGASTNREKFHNLLPGCDKIELPLNQQALQQLEALLSQNEVAAFFMEPIICNMGVIIPENEFMKSVDQLCKKHGTLLVIDEAITGFGRTGKFFATEHYDIKPDILILAKAMSGGYAGIGAAITTKEVAAAANQEVGLYSTYGWHPLSVDAALASIRLMLENTEDLMGNIQDISSLFKQELNNMNFKEAPEVRIKGLAIGVDVKQEEYASSIKEKGIENGLLISSEGSSITFLPALNIERELVEEGLHILRKLI